MSSVPRVLERLEALWDEPSGALYRLRQGEFTGDIEDAVLSVLRTLDLDAEGDAVFRRAVSLIWYLPLFIGWQEERVAERGSDGHQLRRFRNQVTNEVERLLGVP